MGHSTGTTGSRQGAPRDSANETSVGTAAGREWDSESFERIDDRDAENIDLDTECVNESLERKGSCA